MDLLNRFWDVVGEAARRHTGQVGGRRSEVRGKNSAYSHNRAATRLAKHGAGAGKSEVRGQMLEVRFPPGERFAGDPDNNRDNHSHNWDIRP